MFAIVKVFFWSILFLIAPIIISRLFVLLDEHYELKELKEKLKKKGKMK